ncbi:glutamate--cysteine ligase [Streptomyces griseus]|uniref:glutamate--cysteine ligase n=1 Tax=Streptomyces griseus TaxID=1911 RepID=UPI0004C4A97C|nr:glutamate--cysteine ligase [Streptomyces griseus]
MTETSTHHKTRTVGVEEELLLVSARTGEPLALSSAVLAAAAGEEAGDVFEKELHQEQLEFATRPVADMAALQEEIVRWRGEARRHAGSVGAQVAALATSPLPVEPSRNLGRRYRWLADQFALTAQEQLTGGCHVHVSVESDEEGVAVLDRIRPWLPLLTAISANSPYWQGQDTGYASYRSRVWYRLPSAGPYEPFGSAAAYHARVRDMLTTGVLRDQGMIYFDARLSSTFPTVEVRVADVCLEPGTTVLVATLARALVETVARAWRSGESVPRVPVEALRLAAWQAARSGPEGRLLDPRTLHPVPAEAAFDALLAFTETALRETGDLDRARAGLKDVLAGGGGARRQRDLFESGMELGEVVRECARITAEDADHAE